MLKPGHAMNKKKRPIVAELNPHLLCILCGGYYVDATTVIECLHTFCKSCIVRYLETSKFCPTCDVLVHKSEPLLSIRPDKSLQNIVYKLIPGLYQNEMFRRKKFYSELPAAKPISEEDRGNPCNSAYLLPSDTVSVALKPIASDENQGENGTQHTRYFNCPAGVTLGQLKRLLRAKFELPEKHPLIISSPEDTFLEDELTLIDVAYIKSWEKDSPLILYYKIYFNKKIKLEMQFEEKSIKLEESDIKVEENGSAYEVPCMPHLQREEENDLGLDSESRSIPTLSPIKAVSPETPSPPPSPLISPVVTTSLSSVCSSVVPFYSPASAKSVSPSTPPTFKAIIPAPVRPVPDILNLGSFTIPPVNSLTPARNCGLGYGIGLLSDPTASISGLFPGNLIDSTKLGSSSVLPFGLAFAPNLICTAPNISAVNGNFSDQTNLTGLAIQSFINQPDSSNNLILSLGNQNTPGVRPIPPQPISSIIMPEPVRSNSSTPPNSKLQSPVKKPKLIKPKNYEEKSVVEEKEVQLMISESGVMIVNEGEKSANQLQRLDNPIYSEANELLSKIESGSLLSSDPYSEEDSKESDVSDGAEKLAQIKMEISSILNTLSDEGEISTVKSQSSLHLDQSVAIAESSVTTNTICSSVTEYIKSASGSPSKQHENISIRKSTIKVSDIRSSVTKHNAPPSVNPNKQDERGVVKSSFSETDKLSSDLQKAPKLEQEQNNLIHDSGAPANVKDSIKKKVEECNIPKAVPQNSAPLMSNGVLNNEQNFVSCDKSTKKTSRRSSQPIGYKTLKISPKGWNPTIPREKLQKKPGSSSPKTSKFFKTRNSAINSTVTSESPSAAIPITSGSSETFSKLTNSESKSFTKSSQSTTTILGNVSESLKVTESLKAALPLRIEEPKTTKTNLANPITNSNIASPTFNNSVVLNTQNSSLKSNNKDSKMIDKHPKEKKEEINCMENSKKGIDKAGKSLSGNNPLKSCAQRLDTEKLVKQSKSCQEEMAYEVLSRSNSRFDKSKLETEKPAVSMIENLASKWDKSQRSDNCQSICVNGSKDSPTIISSAKVPNSITKPDTILPEIKVSDSSLTSTGSSTSGKSATAFHVNYASKTVQSEEAGKTNLNTFLSENSCSNGIPNSLPLSSNALAIVNDIFKYINTNSTKETSNCSDLLDLQTKDSHEFMLGVKETPGTFELQKKDSISFDESKIPDKIDMISKPIENQNILMPSSTTKVVNSSTMNHSSSHSNPLQVSSPSRKLESNIVSVSSVVNSKPPMSPLKISKTNSQKVKLAFPEVSKDNLNNSASSLDMLRQMPLTNTSTSNESTNSSSSSIKNPFISPSENASNCNYDISKTDRENLLKIIKENMPEFSKASNSIMESQASALPSYECNSSAELSGKLSSELPKSSVSLPEDITKKNVSLNVKNNASSILTPPLPLSIQNMDELTSSSVMKANIQTSGTIENASQGINKSTPNLNSLKSPVMNKNHKPSTSVEISSKVSQNECVGLQNLSSGSSISMSNSALSSISSPSSKLETTIASISSCMSSIITDVLTTVTTTTALATSCNACTLNQGSQLKYTSSNTNSSLISSSCYHSSPTTKYQNAKSSSDMQVNNLGLTGNLSQTGKPKCVTHVVNSTKDIQVTSCNSAHSYPSQWLSSSATSSFALSDTTNSQKSTNKTMLGNAQCVQTSSYSRPSNSENYPNSEALSKSNASASHNCDSGNSGAIPFTQHNSSAEEICFGNSFQNNAFPFFNNFMHFPNAASLPYSTYNNYPTSSNNYYNFNKLKPQLYSDGNKLGTHPPTTRVESSQNSFLSNNSNSQPDTAKFFQNLLAPSSISSNDHKNSFKSSNEEINKLLQTIPSTVCDTRIPDSYQATSEASVASEIKGAKSVASNNEKNVSSKQICNSSTIHSSKQTFVSNNDSSSKQNLQPTVSPKQIPSTNDSPIKTPMTSESNAGNINGGKSLSTSSSKSKNEANKPKISSSLNTTATNKNGQSSSSNENISFENILNDSENQIQKINEMPKYSSPLTTKSFPTCGSESSYKPVYQQTEYCKHHEPSNQRDSSKNSAGQNSQQQNKMNDQMNNSNSPNVKKNGIDKVLPSVSSASCYASYSQGQYFNPVTSATGSVAESGLSKKVQRSGTCAGLSNTHQTSSLGINSVMNNFHDSTPSNLSISQRSNTSQAASWDNNPINPFFFNSNGEAYSMPNPYKSGFSMNANSCIQQNIFRNNNQNSNNSSLNSKDTNINSHTQANFNSSTNSSCSPKNPSLMNAHYGLENNSKKGISNTESYDNFSPGSQKYNSSHASLYYSNYNNNFANFFSNSQGQASSLSSLVSGSGYNFPLPSSKFSGGQQYLNFSQNTPNNSYFPSSNFSMNSSSPNYQNCINHCPSPNTGGSNMSSNLGNNFSGPLCNISLPYYSNCSFSYNSYPYLYQGGDMGLLSPTASFMPPFSCLPSRPSLGSRNASSSQSFNDFSLQSGFFPMMPFVSPLQGNGARATPPPVGGGISHSFGSRPFQSNYSNKPMTYESSTKVSQKSQQLPKTNTGSSGASSSKSRNRKSSTSSKTKSASGKETNAKGAKGPLSHSAGSECSPAVSLEANLNNRVQPNVMEDNSSNNNNYTNTNYNNNYSNNNMNDNSNGLADRVNMNSTSLEKQKKREEFPSL